MRSLTKSGAIMGTPQYMAPEQAWGRIEEVGPSADIYSLGAIMYEMLTGRPPFTGDSFQVITEVRSRPPVPPRQRRDSIDPGLEAICMKCLEKTVERRYQSMGHLADDLQRFMDGGQVDALSESRHRTLKSTLRRKLKNLRRPTHPQDQRHCRQWQREPRVGGSSGDRTFGSRRGSCSGNGSSSVPIENDESASLGSVTRPQR